MLARLEQAVKDINAGAANEINLQNCFVGDGGCKRIAGCLKENKSITSIKLRNCFIGDGTLSIADSLKINKSITSIDLSDNGIRDKGAQSIADALKVNTSITLLDLSDNYIEESTRQHIRSLLERNKAITERRQTLAALLSCLSKTRTSGPAFNDSSFEKNHMFDIWLLGLVVQFVA